MLTVTATDLKNNTADIINHAYYNSPVVVTRNGKTFVKVVKVTDSEDNKKNLRASWKKFYGAFPMLPSAEELRKSRFIRKDRVKW